MCLSVCVCAGSEELIVLTHRLLCRDWLNHTKYGPLCILVPHVGATACLRLCPSLVQTLLMTLSHHSLTTAVRSFYLYFLHAGPKKPQSFMRINVATVQDAMKRFYRATLCVKRGLCCRLGSVCPSVTLTYCIDKAEDIIKLLSRPGSLIILVFFRSRALLPNSKGNPFSGAQNTWGWENF